MQCDDRRIFLDRAPAGFARVDLLLLQGNDSITHCQAEQPAQDGHLKPDRLALEFCTTLLYVLAEKSSLIYLDKNAAADNPARFGRENLSRSCRELGQMVY